MDMDLGKVTVFVIKDFAKTDYFAIPLRKPKPRIIIEISDSDPNKSNDTYPTTCTNTLEAPSGAFDAIGAEAVAGLTDNLIGLPCIFEDEQQKRRDCNADCNADKILPVNETDDLIMKECDVTIDEIICILELEDDNSADSDEAEKENFGFCKTPSPSTFSFHDNDKLLLKPSSGEDIAANPDIEFCGQEKSLCVTDRPSSTRETPFELSNRERDIPSIANGLIVKSKDCDLDMPVDNTAVDFRLTTHTVRNISPLIPAGCLPNNNNQSCYEQISPPAPKQPIYEPTSPPNSPVSSGVHSHFVTDDFTAKRPPSVYSNAVGSSYEPISPQLDAEELKRKAEKEFLKELWQEGSGRINVASKDDNGESQQRQHLSTSASKSNFKSTQSSAHRCTVNYQNDYSILANLPNQQTNVINAPIFNAAMNRPFANPQFHWCNCYGNNNNYSLQARPVVDFYQQTQTTSIRTNGCRIYARDYAAPPATTLTSEDIFANSSPLGVMTSGDKYEPEQFPISTRQYLPSQISRAISVPVGVPSSKRASMRKRKKSFSNHSSGVLRDISNNDRLQNNSTTRANEPTAVATGNMYPARIQNYYISIGINMMLNSTRNPRPTPILNPMPTPSQSYLTYRAESHNLPTAISASNNNNCTQAQYHSATLQEFNSARYPNVLSDNCSFQRTRLTPNNGTYLVAEKQQQIPQYGQYPSNSQRTPQHRGHTNGTYIQQQRQFLHPGQLSTPRCAVSANTVNYRPTQEHVASVNNQATSAVQTNVVNSFLTQNEHVQNTAPSNATISHHKSMPTLLPNPSERKNHQPVNFVRSHLPTTGTTQSVYSQPVEINGMQQFHMHRQTGFQSLANGARVTTTVGSQLPTQQIPLQIPRDVSTTTARVNQLLTPSNPTAQIQSRVIYTVPLKDLATVVDSIQPTIQRSPLEVQVDMNFFVTLKNPCQSSLVGVNSHERDMCGRLPSNERVVPNQDATYVSNQDPARPLPYRDFVILQHRPRPIPQTVSNGSLAGNTLPGDMLMTKRNVGVPVGKRSRGEKNQTKPSKSLFPMNEYPPFKSQKRLGPGYGPNANSVVSSTSVTTIEEVAPDTSKSNSPSPENSSGDLEPFVHFKPSTERTSITLVPSTPSESIVPSVPTIVRRTSVEKTSELTPPSNIASVQEVAVVKCTETHDNSVVASVIGQRNLPIKKRTLSPQSSSDASPQPKSRDDTTTKININQTTINNNESETTLTETGQEDSYGYDYKSLAEALGKLKQLDTNVASSSDSAELQKEYIDPSSTEEKDTPHIVRRMAVPPSLKTNEIQLQRRQVDDELNSNCYSMATAKKSANLLPQTLHFTGDTRLDNSGETVCDAAERSHTVTTPTKSPSKDRFSDSTTFSSPSKSPLTNRRFKRLIPPISSDSDTDNTDSDKDYEALCKRLEEKRNYRSCKPKKKRKRIIEQSESSESEEDVDTSFEVRVHSPKSSKREINYAQNSKQFKYSGDISLEEYTYMTSCRVVLMRHEHEDINRPFKVPPSYFENENGKYCESPQSKPVEISNSPMLQNTPMELQGNKVQHSNITDDISSRNLPDNDAIDSFMQLNCNKTPRSQSNKPQTVSSPEKLPLRNESLQCWRETQNYFSETVGTCQTLVDGDQDSDASQNLGALPISSESKDSQPDLSSFPEQRWRENISFSTDSTRTSESKMSCLHNESYFSESEECEGLSDTDVDDTPCHSEVDDTPFPDHDSNDDDDVILKYVTPNLNDKENERPPTKFQRVEYEDELEYYKENASTLSDVKARTRSLDADETEIEESELIIIERMENDQEVKRYADSEEEFSSSYTSSNSGSPVKCSSAVSGEDNMWPFSVGNVTNECSSEEEKKSSGRNGSLYSTSSKEIKKRHKRRIDDYMNDEFRDLLKHKKSFGNDPEVQLTKSLKLRNRRTHKSRKKRTKNEYLKTFNLLESPWNLPV